ncbi:MAG: family 43 glycosylhydrolase [Clostridia bacterium]|nr:family 43 glycosylhydrolase [Clostridia bacterium]
MKQAFNPYLPLDEYIPDGEPHVFGDRVYVYGSHDKENGEAFCMLDYVCYSASIYDLKGWQYEGVIYRARQDPLFEKFPYMFAPDVVRGNDGRYYLYYSMAEIYPNCSYIMSVAVCDTPAGEFEFLGYVKNEDGTLFTEKIIFDPGVINDDGIIRLYFGMRWDFEEQLSYEDAICEQMKMFSRSHEEIEAGDGVMGAFMVELCPDMLTVKGQVKRILPRYFRGTDFEGHEFFEASSMRKVGEKYYFIYSTFNNHELAYATSDYPDRGFKFGGVIVSNGDIGYNGRLPEDKLMRTGNNHGSIELINGKWYVFYHRHTTKTELSRQGCAEEIHFLQNGKIPQVEITSCGLNGGALVGLGTYPSIICCNLTNGKMPQGQCVNQTLPHIICKNGERIISEIGDSTIIGYKYFRFSSLRKIGIKYRGGEAKPKGKLQVLTDLNGDAICELEIASPSEWTISYATLDFPLTVSSAPLFFKYTGEGLFDLIEIIFE